MLDTITTAYQGTGVDFLLTTGGITKTDGSAVVSMSEKLVGLKGANATAIAAGDTFTFSGTGVGTLTVTAASTVQDLLTFIETTYAGTTAVLDSGKIRVMDPSAGGVTVTMAYNDTTGPSSGANPFGLTDDAVATTLTAPPTPVQAIGVASLGSDGKIQIVDPFNTGNLGVSVNYISATVVPPPATNIANPFGLVNGVGVTALVSNTSSGGNKISDLLAFLDATYGGKKGEVHTVLDQDGKIRLVDLAQSKGLSVNVQYDKGANGISANPFGLVSGAVPTGATPTLTQKASVEGQVNITTSKKMVQSLGRALSTNTGDTAQIQATTQWSSVFDDNSDPIQNGGLPRGVSNGDAFTFTGTKRDGSSVTSTFTVAYTKTDGNPGTVQDLLTQLELAFDCQASIDSVGRLVLTDRVADTVATASSLAISSVAYDTNASGQDIFGPTGTAFDFVRADVSSEDGSQQGDVVTSNFAAEALSTTQYANSSTTIFQDQDGFASGFLQSLSTDVDGVITGHYSNGQVLKKAQVALANFSNLAGLSKRGGNVFTETSESGAPVTGAPGTNGLGSIAPNALEQSNVDLGVEFVKLITVQRGFQANSKIITTTDDMLNELINIKR
jgi:flagellar hook protein FlgE